MTDNFIGVYENAVPHDLCDAVINYFERLNSLGVTYHRQSSVIKDDNAVILDSQTIELLMEDPMVSKLIQIIWQNYTNYIKNFSTFLTDTHVQIKSIKIQRTGFCGGYHTWHYENLGLPNRNRFLVWSLYLNDVDDGGETEFLHQRVRIKPKKGSLLIWPAGLTHPHRGNPPLSNVKYIATSWIEYQG
jgi:hypothetical protein